MSKYTAEQVDACILCYKSGDLNYCRQGIVDLLTDYAALLRERESAKAGVTDEMIERAARAMCRKFDPPSSLDEMATCDKWRRFADEARCCLEAVAPMLASARVPERTSDMTKFVDGLGWVVRLSDVPEYTKRLIEQTRDLLAAAPKSEAEE